MKIILLVDKWGQRASLKPFQIYKLINLVDNAGRHNLSDELKTQLTHSSRIFSP